MYNYKRMLLFIGLIAAIIAAMPNTISLFGGDHTMPREVDCNRCHEPSEEALSSLGMYPGDESCATCHRCNLANYTELRANGTGACTECHEIGLGCPRAEGFTKNIQND
jgi:hypothetical protein